LIRNLLAILAQKKFAILSLQKFFILLPKPYVQDCFPILSYEASRQGSLSFDIPFNRQQLADYLNLDRSALSNELSKIAKRTDHYLS